MQQILSYSSVYYNIYDFRQSTGLINVHVLKFSFKTYLFLYGSLLCAEI
jgi:hypothetical protein